MARDDFIAAPSAGGPGWAVPAHRTVHVAKSGLVFSEKIGLQEWEVIGQRLMSVADSAAWWIADWLVYGESTFLDRYQEAVKRTSLSYQTLRNYTWIARRFDLSRRRDSLSFGHHGEVAALDPPEQDYWLRKAEEFSWSCSRLRNEVRHSLRGRQSEEPLEHADLAPSNDWGRSGGTATAPDLDDVPEPSGASLNLEFTPDQFAQFRSAASKEGLSISAWAAHILLAAATNVHQATASPPSR
jgi:hypothetical protein